MNKKNNKVTYKDFCYVALGAIASIFLLMQLGFASNDIRYVTIYFIGFIVSLYLCDKIGRYKGWLSRSTFYGFTTFFIVVALCSAPLIKRSLTDFTLSDLLEIIEKNDTRRGRYGRGPTHFYGYKVNEQTKDGNLLLVIAAAQRNLDAVGEALVAGADPNLQDKNGMTALHFAAYYGDEAMVKKLLSRDANPNIKNKTGHTPRMIAHDKGYQIIETLLNA
ncbi:MAG: ankyrin repeat domain-containing protein [Candidatus Babeliales bacterium]